MLGWPGKMVVMGTGFWEMAVWVGNGASEGGMGEIGVPNCASNEVLVADGTAGIVEVELGRLVWEGDIEVGGEGVLVRGCNRYEPVIAIEVLVLLAFRISASLAGPPEAIQMRINKLTNRPVIPSACR